MKHTILVLLIIAFQSSISSSQSINRKYTIFQEEVLSKGIHGISGSLQLLRDDRLKSDSEADDSLSLVSDYLDAILQIVDIAVQNKFGI